MSPDFSLLGRSFERYEAKVRLDLLYTPAPAWTGKDATESARIKRIDRARTNYKEFDKIYFPPDVYDGQYAEPNAFHFTIAQACEQANKHCTMILGPNEHAKSATIYKHDIYDALFGNAHLIVYASETLDTPRRVLQAISAFIKLNRRIQADFPDITFINDSVEYVHIRCGTNPRGTAFRAVSEERSALGMTQDLFYRIDRLHVEDFENRTSSMTQAAVAERKRKIGEYRRALSQRGCMTITANNFDERCLANQLLNDSRNGFLDEHFTVRAYPAWGTYYDKRGHFRIDGKATTDGPLWKARYPVKTEADLRSMMKPIDDEDWQGAQQQRPVKPRGYFFHTDHVIEDDPSGHCIAITWVDPNLAKKGKGDRTALGALLYDFATGLFFAQRLRYKSYASSNDLLDDLRWVWEALRTNGHRLIAAGMDGNVNQESHWSQHVENYARLNGIIMPPIDYKHYNVELYAKNAQLVWSSKRVRWQGDWLMPDEKRNFFDDLHAFTGRKLAGKRDDAPDWLISAIQFFHELGVGLDTGLPSHTMRTHTSERSISSMRIGRL